jgi:hypothetical protein
MFGRTQLRVWRQDDRRGVAARYSRGAPSVMSTKPAAAIAIPIRAGRTAHTGGGTPRSLDGLGLWARGSGHGRRAVARIGRPRLCGRRSSGGCTRLPRPARLGAPGRPSRRRPCCSSRQMKSRPPCARPRRPHHRRKRRRRIRRCVHRAQLPHPFLQHGQTPGPADPLGDYRRRQLRELPHESQPQRETDDGSAQGVLPVEAQRPWRRVSIKLGI